MTKVKFEGFLQKQPSSSTGEPVEERYRDRYLILVESMGEAYLNYYATSESYRNKEEPFGCFPIIGNGVCVFKRISPTDFCLSLTNEKKRLWCRGKSSEVVDAWEVALLLELGEGPISEEIKYQGEILKQPTSLSTEPDEVKYRSRYLVLIAESHEGYIHRNLVYFRDQTAFLTNQPPLGSLSFSSCGVRAMLEQKDKVCFQFYLNNKQQLWVKTKSPEDCTRWMEFIQQEIDMS